MKKFLILVVLVFCYSCQSVFHKNTLTEDMMFKDPVSKLMLDKKTKLPVTGYLTFNNYNHEFEKAQFEIKNGIVQDKIFGRSKLNDMEIILENKYIDNIFNINNCNTKDFYEMVRHIKSIIFYNKNTLNRNTLYNKINDEKIQFKYFYKNGKINIISNAKMDDLIWYLKEIDKSKYEEKRINFYKETTEDNNTYTFSMDQKYINNAKGTMYYIDGKKFLDFEIHDSNINYTSYYENGNKNEEGIKVYDNVNGNQFIYNGRIYSYNKKGIMITSKNYINNVEDGVFYYFYDSGKLKEKENYNSGELTLAQFYNENGNLNEVEHYSKGYLQGLVEKYNSHNVLISSEKYHNDVKDGESDYFYDSGALKMKNFYQNGTLTSSITFKENNK